MNKMFTLYKLGSTWSADKVSSCAVVWAVASVHAEFSHSPCPLSVNKEDGRCERALTKWKTNDRSTVVASPCLKEVQLGRSHRPVCRLVSDWWEISTKKYYTTAHSFLRRRLACIEVLLLGFNLVRALSHPCPISRSFIKELKVLSIKCLLLLGQN